MKITKINANTSIYSKRPVFAADDDDFDSEDEDIVVEDPEEDSVGEQIDDLSDAIEDVQDSVDEVEEDEVDIEQDVNIAGHYIAECERCHGIFISPVVESEQDILSIDGVCPICGKETQQDLNWVIRDKKEERGEV